MKFLRKLALLSDQRPFLFICVAFLFLVGTALLPGLTETFLSGWEMSKSLWVVGPLLFLQLMFFFPLYFRALVVIANRVLGRTMSGRERRIQILDQVYRFYVGKEGN